MRAVDRAVRYLSEHPRELVIAILVAALAIRVATIVATPDYSPTYDSADYVRHAVSIATGEGYPDSVFAEDGPTAFRPPAYPYLLGTVYAVFGDGAGETAGRVLGALLGTLAVYLTFLLGRRLWGLAVGAIAAAIAAVFPPLVLLNASLISEPLFLNALLAVVLVVLLARERPGDWRLAALAGVLCGFAALTRANGILVVIPAVIGVWVGRPRFSRAALLPPLVVIVAAAITVVPWVVRNSLVFDRVMPLTSQSGFAMAGAFNDEAREFPGYPGTWVLPEVTERYGPIYARTDLDEAELDRELRSSALDYAADHPGYVIETIVRNTLRTFDLSGYPEISRAADERQLGIGERAGQVVRWSTYLLDLLALAGVAALLIRPRERRGPWFIWLVPPLMVLAAVWAITSTRYRIPLYPFMALLAAIAAVDLWERRRAARDPRGADSAA